MEPTEPGVKLTDQQLEDTMELYNKSIAGKQLTDIVTDREYVVVGLALSEMLMRKALEYAFRADLDDVQTRDIVMGQIISVGIFLAELGKTQMLKPREAVQ